MKRLRNAPDHRYGWEKFGEKIVLFSRVKQNMKIVKKKKKHGGDTIIGRTTEKYNK
jgi:hypothetical protein